MILEGANGIGCKGFVHSIRSISGSKAPALEQANKMEFVDGKQWEGLSQSKVPRTS